MLRLILASLAMLAVSQFAQARPPSTERRSEAASGQSDVAIELFEFYMEAGDAANSAFWLRVAAEQGNCQAMVEYSRMVGAGLGKKKEQQSWLDRARELECDLSGAVYHPKPRDKD